VGEVKVHMASENQRNASRINGSKSKGPVSVEGRARSSRNSIRHGLSSKIVVLPHENRTAFEDLRDSYVDDFQPANQSQHDLVETMVAARWRLNRLVETEAKIFEMEMLRHDDDIEKEFENTIQVEKVAWVFDHLANHNKSLQLLIRYEGSLNRSYERAYKQLKEMQKDRPPQQNEPEPAPIAVLPPPISAPEKCPSDPMEPPVAPSAPPPTPETGPSDPEISQKEP
jgi:hypothetical protein